MATDPTDLQQFHKFVADQLARGDISLSPEDCLDAWRASHPLSEEFAEAVAAVQEGLAQARRGEGISLDEFVQRFRAEKGIAPPGT